MACWAGANIAAYGPVLHDGEKAADM